jgi:hypothetical protein
VGGNREATEKAIEALASECIDELVLSLLKVLQRLDSEPRGGGKDGSVKDTTESTRLVLQMMCRCLNAQWTSLRAKYSDLMCQITELEQKIRLTEKLQAVVPPPLVETTARAVVDMTCRAFAVEELRPSLLELVFFISMSNADIVVDRVCKDLEAYLDKKSAANTSDELLPGLHFLRAANLPSDHLQVRPLLLLHHLLFRVPPSRRIMCAASAQHHQLGDTSTEAARLGQRIVRSRACGRLEVAGKPLHRLCWFVAAH